VGGDAISIVGMRELRSSSGGGTVVLVTSQLCQMSIFVATWPCKPDQCCIYQLETLKLFFRQEMAMVSLCLNCCLGSADQTTMLLLLSTFTRHCISVFGWNLSGFVCCFSLLQCQVALLDNVCWCAFATALWGASGGGVCMLVLHLWQIPLLELETLHCLDMVLETHISVSGTI